MLQDSQQQEVSEIHIDESILKPEIHFSGVAIGHGAAIIKILMLQSHMVVKYLLEVLQEVERRPY